MKLNTELSNANSNFDVGACAPPIRFIQDIHEASHSLNLLGTTLVVLAGALLIVGLRLHRRGWHGWGRVTQFIAFLVAVVGVLCALAGPWSQGC